MRRRSFLKIGSIASAVPLLGSAVSARGPFDVKVPEPYDQVGSEPGDPTSPVFHRHPLELDTLKRQAERAESDSAPKRKYHPVLSRKLADGFADGTSNLLVTTVGERAQIRSKGSYKREINGWTAKAAEIERLSEFGEVAFAPKFASTKVNLHGVTRDEVADLAELPFVLEVNYDPEFSDDDAGTETHANDDVGIESHETKNVLREPGYLRFDMVEDDYNIPLGMKIGIIDRGYEGDGGRFSTAWAEEVGIDEFRAEDFADDWDDPESDHGDNVANTAAFFTQPQGHSNLFVPLRRDSDEASAGIRAAIEYAEEWDMEVINMSFGWDPEDEDGGWEPEGTCPSILCDLLDSYTDAGYIPVASTGNEGYTTKVNHPGTDYFSVSVGMAHGNCHVDDDEVFQRRYNSNYGTIMYEDPFEGVTYCHYCNNEGSVTQFMPDVYGYSPFGVDGGRESVGGTSNAAPQVAAAALILQSNDVFDLGEAHEIFRGMDLFGICPTDDDHPDPAREGQLLDALEALEESS